jgi:hypothetical protein
MRSRPTASLRPTRRPFKMPRPAPSRKTRIGTGSALKGGVAPSFAARRRQLGQRGR